LIVLSHCDLRESDLAMSRYTYHPDILEALAAHGLRPLPSTSPDRLRDAVRDLYKYEIKRTRAVLLAGGIARPDYASHIVNLRKRYWLLSVPTEMWVRLRDDM
jgi:hypothetical protein